MPIRSNVPLNTAEGEDKITITRKLPHLIFQMETQNF